MYVAVCVDRGDAIIAGRPSDIAKLVVRSAGGRNGGQVSNDIAAGVDLGGGLAKRQARYVYLFRDNGVSMTVVGLIIFYQRNATRTIARLDDHITAKGDAAGDRRACKTVYRRLATVDLGGASDGGTARRRSCNVQPTAADDQRAFAVYRSIIRVGYTHFAHIVACGLTVNSQGTTRRNMNGIVLMHNSPVDENYFYVADNV